MVLPAVCGPRELSPRALAAETLFLRSENSSPASRMPGHASSSRRRYRLSDGLLESLAGLAEPRLVKPDTLISVPAREIPRSAFGRHTSALVKNVFRSGIIEIWRLASRSVQHFGTTEDVRLKTRRHPGRATKYAADSKPGCQFLHPQVKILTRPYAPAGSSCEAKT